MGSNGGVYKILISDNNNTQDKILIANDLLSKKIEKLKYLKNTKLKSDIKEILICIDKYEKDLNNKKLSNDKKSIIQDKINTLKKELNIKKLEDTNINIKEINTHHIFLESSFKPFVSIGYEYSKVPVSPIPSFGNSIKIKVPKYGDFFNDMVVYVKLENFKPISPTNRVKYCNFLGHRIFKKIKFIVNNIVLDEYNTEDYNFYYQFNVPENKKNSWKKCVGQEIPKLGTLTSDPTYQDFRKQVPVLDGPQTAKKEHTKVEMAIPLLFWFKDPKLAIPNITLPFGQTFIEFELNNVDDLCSCVDYASDGGLFQNPTISDLHLYTNHIYINPDILDIFIKRISITLIRVHKQQEIILNQSFNEVLLNELKFPIETMYVAFRPTENMNTGDYMETWNKNSKLNKKLIPTPIVYDTTGSGDYALGNNFVIYYEENRVVDILGLKADNVSIFQETPSLFYNSYIPYQYGINTTSPQDKDTFMFSFNFDPDNYQPNGYLNLSKIRRFYLYYNSSVINSTNTCKLYVSAKTINFLLLKDGKFTLQYNV